MNYLEPFTVLYLQCLSFFKSFNAYIYFLIFLSDAFHYNLPPLISFFLSLSLQTSTPSVSPRFLTSGNWDVTSLCALDEENDTMYDRLNFMSKPFLLESLKNVS